MERTLCAGQIAGRLLFFAVALAGVSGVHISELNVPGLVRNGTTENVILDCDYSLNENEKQGLVVKWFYNKENTPVYQWIHGQRPQDLGILRDRLDLQYIASDDQWEAHRALSIKNPTTQLSGEWLCRVSTFAGDAYKSARMIVYAPEKEMDIKLVSRPTPDSINISCWAYGVYPEPKLSITYGHNNRVEDLMIDSTWNDGSYDVTVHKVIYDKELETVPGVFDCELKIPNTSYISRKIFLYGGPQTAEKDDDGNEYVNSTTEATGDSEKMEAGFVLSFIVAMHILFT